MQCSAVFKHDSFVICDVMSLKLFIPLLWENVRQSFEALPQFALPPAQSQRLTSIEGTFLLDCSFANEK